MKNVKILGAGIAGLTAAINLAKNGYNVEVHEKLSDVGKNHRLNFEGLENWTTDIMGLLRKINIKTNFRKKPMKKVTWYSPSFNDVVLEDKSPFFYLVERGSKNSIESNLKKQALDAGVDIMFNSIIKYVDIVSTGASKPMGMGFGTFYDNVNHDDTVIGILSNSVSPNGYFYLLVWNGQATVCTTTTRVDMFKDISKIHQKNLKLGICKNILKGSKKRHEFSGFTNYNVPMSAVEDNRILTGEAAGFQDAFLGFGMKYAFISGYLAAKSIIDNISYDYLWKKAFGRELKKTSQSRFYLNIFGNRKYEDIIDRMKNYKGSYRSMLKNIYTDYSILSEITCHLIR